MAALALCISAVGLACSGGPSAKPLALKTTSAGQGSASGSPAAGGSGAPAATGSGGSATTSAPVPGTSAPTSAAAPAATSPTTQTTTAPVSHSNPTTQPTSTPSQAPASTGPQATTPGTYSYNGSGTTLIETSSGTQSLPAAAQTTLTISGGGSSEQWANSVTTENLTFNASGVFLTSETLSSATGAAGTTCVFGGQGVAYPPWPLAVGKSSSGTANCGSGTLNLSVQVVSQSGSNFVVKITQTSGSLKVTETDTYSPSLRMPIATSFVILGSYGSTAVSTQSSYTLA